MSYSYPRSNHFKYDNVSFQVTKGEPRMRIYISIVNVKTDLLAMLFLYYVNDVANAKLRYRRQRMAEK